MLDQTAVSTLRQAYDAFLEDQDFRSLRARVHTTGLVYYGPVILGRTCVIYLHTDKETPVPLGEIPETYREGW